MIIDKKSKNLAKNTEGVLADSYCSVNQKITNQI
jgi:hypothetical protein